MSIDISTELVRPKLLSFSANKSFLVKMGSSKCDRDTVGIFSESFKSLEVISQVWLSEQWYTTFI